MILNEQQKKSADFVFGFADAIKRLRPTAKFELYNTNITKWEDEDPSPPPSLDIIMQQYEADRKLYESLEYARFRKKEYPNPEEQLDSLWHAVNSGEIIDQNSDWFNTIKEVKNRYPKP
jgi:hypothetical protein